MRLALIGSRETPRRVLDVMSLTGQALSESGHFSYSGGAPGADESWLSRYDRERSLRIIPYEGFNGLKTGVGVKVWKDFPNEVRIRSVIKAREVTSYWDECRDIVKTLFARNALQVLGEDCQSPVDMVLFYAPIKLSSVTGGTRVAVDIAKRHGIPCYNLYEKEIYHRFKEKYAPTFDIFAL